jgi:hypothetical protein
LFLFDRIFSSFYFIVLLLEKAPHHNDILSYVTEMHNRQLAGRSISRYNAALITACELYGGVASYADIRKLVNGYIDADPLNKFEVFDFAVHLPGLFNVCWKSTTLFQDAEVRLQFWTMFLISIILMASAQDVTTYCPVFEDLELPPPEAHYWDIDGVPKFVIIGLRYLRLC